ncbi:hypothetical protein PT2222_320032 [Paraburkholderia tropica]
MGIEFPRGRRRTVAIADGSAREPVDVADRSATGDFQRNGACGVSVARRVNLHHAK